MEKELEDILSKIDRQASNYHRRVINYCKEFKTNPSDKKEKLICDCLYAERYCKYKRKVIEDLYPVYTESLINAIKSGEFKVMSLDYFEWNSSDEHSSFRMEGKCLSNGNFAIYLNVDAPQDKEDIVNVSKLIYINPNGNGYYAESVSSYKSVDTSNPIFSIYMTLESASNCDNCLSILRSMALNHKIRGFEMIDKFDDYSRLLKVVDKNERKDS